MCLVFMWILLAFCRGNNFPLQLALCRSHDIVPEGQSHYTVFGRKGKGLQKALTLCSVDTHTQRSFFWFLFSILLKNFLSQFKFSD